MGLSNNEQNPERSVARDDDSSTDAGNIIIQYQIITAFIISITRKMQTKQSLQFPYPDISKAYWIVMIL